MKGSPHSPTIPGTACAKSIGGRLLLGGLAGLWLSGLYVGAEETDLEERIRSAIQAERMEEAIQLTEEALEKDKDETTLLRLYAQLCEKQRIFPKAVEAYGRLTQLLPKNPIWWHRRGVAKFMAGDFEGSVQDFDVYLEKRPQEMPSHWQRGLSHYGAKMFREGRAQFEAHQKVNSHDVENAAWHFICVAQLEGVEAARKALIPIEGDQRVPMAQVHDLFAGTGSEAAVLEAAKKEHPQRRNHLCYAHLYLALYKEALGETEGALKHYKLAAEDYQMPHYMGETALVFYQSRSKQAKATKAASEDTAP